MTLRRLSAPWVLLALSFVIPLRAVKTQPELAIDNLVALAELYGYVRYFHPSDEAAAASWDPLGPFAVAQVLEAADPNDLRDRLLAVFAPLAPTLRLTIQGETPADADAEASLKPSEERVTYWQHHGVQRSERASIYRSRRIIPGDEGDRKPLREVTEPPPAAIEVTTTRGLHIHLPSSLIVDATGRTLPRADPPRADRSDNLATRESGLPSAKSVAFRAAGIIDAWTTFQHFHPYLDVAGIDWPAALREALRRTLADADGSDYYATLSEMVAKLEDGHGYVYGAPEDRGGIPIRVAVIEGELVITATEGDAPLQKGDVFVSLDGRPALEVLAERERYVSGSPHLRRHRALNQFGEGPLASTATIVVKRGEKTHTFEIVRRTDRRGFFFNPIGEFSFPDFAEVRPGIYYVNLPGMPVSDLKEKLPQLAEARGIIFDQRWDGRRRERASGQESIQPHVHIMPHLIDEPIHASPMRTPIVTHPNRARWTYRESTWPVQPRQPRLKAKVVFINEPSVVSYGETCMAMIVHYRLATLVGAPTAGCNGNVNFIPLSGGYRVMWTGMEVLRHDRTHFYGEGFAPDHPVDRTLAAVRAGRDEYLETAIRILEGTAVDGQP